MRRSALVAATAWLAAAVPLLVLTVCDWRAWPLVLVAWTAYLSSAAVGATVKALLDHLHDELSD